MTTESADEEESVETEEGKQRHGRHRHPRLGAPHDVGAYLRHGDPAQYVSVDSLLAAPVAASTRLMK